MPYWINNEQQFKFQYGSLKKCSVEDQNESLILEFYFNWSTTNSISDLEVSILAKYTASAVFFLIIPFKIIK